MSLLSGLDNHDRNPCNKWGRYSSEKTTAGDYSGNPENDVVQLITLSPTYQPTTTRSLRNLRQQKQKAIEIIDDKNDSKLRSNTDKNPKDFHAQTSNFTIPKTKKQTRNGKACKESPQGERLQSNGHRKVPTQLQLMPDAQGRATKRTNASEGKTPKKLRRSWAHTPTPRRSDDDVSPRQNDGGNCSPEKVSPPDKRRVNFNRFRKTSLVKDMEVHIVDLKSSQETSDEQMKSPEGKTGKESSRLTETRKSHCGEEIRCPLCNDIVTEAGCITCPKTSDAESPDDEVSPDGFLISAKKKNEESPGSGFRNDTSETDETQTERKEQVNIFSSESQDSDFVETSDVPGSNITQDDLFCPLCNEPKSKIGCGCSDQSEGHSASKTLGFYSRTRISVLHRKYEGG
ncbi:Hypothetical predicted protein, partial [Paramuricea clavata]